MFTLSMTTGDTAPSDTWLCTKADFVHAHATEINDVHAFYVFEAMSMLTLRTAVPAATKMIISG
jgi:hypothetical protein